MIPKLGKWFSECVGAPSDRIGRAGRREFSRMGKKVELLAEKRADCELLI